MKKTDSLTSFKIKNFFSIKGKKDNSHSYDKKDSSRNRRTQSSIIRDDDEDEDKPTSTLTRNSSILDSNGEKNFILIFSFEK